MTIHSVPILEGTRRVGEARRPTRFNALATTVVLGGLVFGIAAGVWWGRDAGVQFSLQRQWGQKCDPAALVPQYDPTPGAMPASWKETGCAIQLGPFLLQWPYSFTTGARRGRWTRELRNQAERQLFETLDFDGAIWSYEQLVTAPDRIQGLCSIDPIDWPFRPLRRQARAYAARGNFHAALATTRRIGAWERSGKWQSVDYDGDTTEWAWEGCRVAAWKRLEARGELAEPELRAALVGNTPLTASTRTFRDPYSQEQGRSEIRLALAELLLRQHRNREAELLLEEIFIRGSPNEWGDCKRLALGYLLRLKPANPIANPYNRKQP